MDNFWKYGENQELNRSLVFSDKDQIIVVSEKEKSELRNEILGIVASSQDKKVMKTLSEAVRKIFYYDYFRCWEDQALLQIQELLNSKNESKFYAALHIFYQLAKLYENEKENSKERKMYFKAFDVIFPFITDFIINSKDKLDNEVAIIIAKKIMKIIYRSINSDVPDIIVKPNYLQIWISSLIEISMTFKTDKKPNLKSEILIENNYQKLVYTSMQILYRFCSKYTNQNITDIKYMKELAIMLKNEYEQFIFKMFLEVLSKSKDFGIPDLYISLIFKYLNSVVQFKKFNDQMDIWVDDVVLYFILPNIILKESDLELRDDNQKVYIYKEFDITTRFNTKRFSSASFVRNLCDVQETVNKKKVSKYSKKVFDFVVNNLNQVNQNIMSNNGNNSQNLLLKEGLMYMLEISSLPMMDAIDDIEIEKLFNVYIMPELENKSNFQILERSIWIIRRYSDIKFTYNETLTTITKQLCNLLVCDDIVIRAYTAATLPKLLKHSEVLNLLEGSVSNLLLEYIKLMHDIDLEELLDGLKTIVDKFGSKVVQYAVELSQELVNQFFKMIKKEDDNNGELYCAAEGVIKILENIFSVISKNKNSNTNHSDIINNIENIISPLIDFTLSGEGFEFLDNGLDLLKEVIECMHSNNGPNVPLSNILWKYFTLINYSIIGDEEENKIILADNPNVNLEGIGYDTMEEHLKILCLFIDKDSKTFFYGVDMKGVSHYLRLENTIKQILKNCEGEKDKSDEVKCIRTYTHIVDSVTLLGESMKEIKDNINLTHILEYAIKLATKKKQQMTINVPLYSLLSSLVIYNPNFVVEYILKTNKNNLKVVISNWTNFVSKNNSSVSELNKNLLGLIFYSFSSKDILQLYSQSLKDYSDIIKIIYQNLIKLDEKRKKMPKDVYGDEDDEDDEFNENLKKVSFLLLKGKRKYGQ